MLRGNLLLLPEERKPQTNGCASGRVQLTFSRSTPAGSSVGTRDLRSCMNSGLRSKGGQQRCGLAQNLRTAGHGLEIESDVIPSCSLVRAAQTHSYGPLGEGLLEVWQGGHPGPRLLRGRAQQPAHTRGGMLQPAQQGSGRQGGCTTRGALRQRPSLQPRGDARDAKDSDLSLGGCPGREECAGLLPGTKSMTNNRSKWTAMRMPKGHSAGRPG
jgi:hypothetical protein